MRKHHNEINSIYYISQHSHAEEHIEKIGPTVRTNSFRHKVFFMAARYVLSTHDGYSIPFKGVNWREFKIVYSWLVPKMQFVFLSHGVSKDDIVENTNYKRTRFDYFVTTTNEEFKEMSSKKYGYPDGNIVQTGFARYDSLQNEKLKIEVQSSIVFMPTWRYYLADVDDQEFMKSEYFKKLYSLMHSKRLERLLMENNVDFYFFPPHHEIQKRIHLFNLENTIVKSLNTENVDFSTILLKNSMLITDYSSVIFDFAYLYKRSVYYQFDLKQFRQGQYKEGYFKYDRDGFGPICTNEKDLMSEISSAIHDDFKINKKYRKRIDETFTLRDNKNSERLFNILNDK